MNKDQTIEERIKRAMAHEGCTRALAMRPYNDPATSYNAHEAGRRAMKFMEENPTDLSCILDGMTPNSQELHEPKPIIKGPGSV